MRRGTIIVILFIVIAAAVVGVSFFLRSQPPLEFTVTVSPLAGAWLRDAAASFNASNPTINGTQAIRVAVQPQDEAQIALGESAAWTRENHPAGWIPAAAVTVDFARSRGLPFETLHESVAQTPLVWGGFGDIVADVTNDGQETFDWPAVNEAVAAGPVRLAFRSPSATIDGFAVLLSGAAALTENAVITRDSLRSPAARAWLETTLLAVPNTTTLGASAAGAMAARGPTAGGLALLPESEWLTNLRGQLVNGSTPVQLAYPAYTVQFTFPCTAWDDPSVTDPAVASRADAVKAFCNYLLTPAQQANAARFGLRPADGVLSEDNAALFTAAATYGAQIELPPMAAVQAPNRSDAQLLALSASQISP
ncbi:MAG: hypothetical protein JNL34_05830 [Anaerolineae bacterium]|nr:hypothetical protein [Anaerolineae bacterium]